MFGATKDVTARDMLFGRLPRLAILTLLSLVLTMAMCSAQYCTPDQCDECNLCKCSQRCCHELPELWLINTRCAPRCRNLDNGFDCLIYKRYDRKCCRWVRESRESFLAQEATLPTLFYSHGNSLNHKNAMKSCWQIYCKMRCCAGPKRLVFWSWPAERVFKTERLRVREMIKKNLRIKYVYAEYQGYYMAKLVNQMSLSQRVMMSGHSYGAITASAAAHYLGGGCLRGLTLAGGAPVERPNLRVAAISGAFDHDMLNPGNRYGQTFVAAEKVFVTRNIKDRTLKKWPKTSWRCKRAIGVLGVNANCLGVYRNKLCQQTMTSDVGTSHYLTPHLKSVRFVAALCCLSFPECHTCSVAESNESAEPEIIPAMITDDELSADMEFVFDGDDSHFVFNDAGFDGEELIDVEFIDEQVVEFDRQAMLAATQSNTFGTAGAFNHELTNPDYLATRSSSFQQFAGDESFLRDMTTNVATAKTAQPQQASPQAQPTVETQLAGATAAKGHSVWYRYGLCLAIVLTGQFYVLFSKRVTSS